MHRNSKLAYIDFDVIAWIIMPSIQIDTLLFRNCFNILQIEHDAVRKGVHTIVNSMWMEVMCNSNQRSNVAMQNNINPRGFFLLNLVANITSI